MRDIPYNDLPEESAEELYENAPCGYVSFLPDGTIFKINTTLLKLVNYSKEEVVGKKRIQDLLKIGGKIYFETHFFPLVKMQGFVREVNLELLTKSGSSVSTLFNVDEVTNPQKEISTYRASILDITDRKKYELVLLSAKERAEKATRAKAEFLSTISHEIRTPLNAIVGIGNLFQNTSLNELQKKYARILQLSSGNLLELVNNLLDLSKLEAQKVKLEERNFSLGNLLEVLIHSFRIKASEKNIELRTNFPEQLPDHLLGDQIKLNQVLTNLLGNAIKFTNHGYVELKIEVLKLKNSAVELRFTVSDTGIGIPEDKLEVIFSEFSQASYDVNLEFGGTGLGLTISQKLLQMFGSNLEVESEEGKGAKFSFDLNIKLAQGAFESQKEHPGVEDRLRRLNPAVLVVDDNPTNLFISSQYLNGWGLDPKMVNSGPEALKAVKEQHFDIILMDLHMPKMNGYECSEKIRELQLDPDPVIIALSASGRGDVNLKMKRAGIQAYVPKPFDPDELKKVMLELFSKHIKGETPEIFKEENHSANEKSKETSSEIKVDQFSLLRFAEVAKGDEKVYRKLVENALHSMRKYRKEFAAIEGTQETKANKVSDLIHKNTMTLHYLEASSLSSKLEKYREILANNKVSNQEQVAIKDNILEDFEDIINSLKEMI